MTIQTANYIHVGPQIILVNADGSLMVRPWLMDVGTGTFATPDGRTIYTVSKRSDGVVEIETKQRTLKNQTA